MTNPNEVTDSRPLTGSGQINVGDKVQFTLGSGDTDVCATAAAILFPGTLKEEIVYNRQKNHYFITSMVLDGTSHHKNVMVKPSALTLAIEQSWNTRTSATSSKTFLQERAQLEQEWCELRKLQAAYTSATSDAAIAQPEQPALQPLTDEQILDECSHHGFIGSRPALIKYTRAIEAAILAAHIKGLT